MKKENVVAVVPVREGSSRIKDKNFVTFGEDLTLVHRKLRHLSESDCFSHIYVSSDSKRAERIAKECGVEFRPRDPVMCTSKPRWDEVVCAIMDTVPGDPHVLWAMVTSPLFTRYAEAVEVYIANLGDKDSLVGVKEMREYFVDEHGSPFFWAFGAWHPYSNELKSLFAINYTVFIAKKSDQLLWRYWIGKKPYLFRCGAQESIDVNFPEDLVMARLAEKSGK